MRILSGVFGLIAGTVAICISLLFIANGMQEMQSAKQYHGHSLSLVPLADAL